MIALYIVRNNDGTLTVLKKSPKNGLASKVPASMLGVKANRFRDLDLASEAMKRAEFAYVAASIAKSGLMKNRRINNRAQRRKAAHQLRKVIRDEI